MFNNVHFPPHPYPQFFAPNQPALQLQLNNAIIYGSEQEMGMLVDRALNAGARFDLQAPYASHPMVLAVRANKPWAVAILMARGVPLPDMPADRTDLLMESCRAGHTEMARALLTVGEMTPAEENNLGMTALHFAVLSGSSETVQLLLDSGADCDVPVDAGDLDAPLDELQQEQNFLPDDSVTPLMMAVALGRADLVRQLLEAGAHMNIGPRSALVVAVRQGNAAVVQAFLDTGHDPNDCIDEHDNEGLEALIYPEAGIDCLRLLMPHFPLGEISDGGYSPLADAVSQNLPQVAALLLASFGTDEDLARRLEDCWDDAARTEQSPGALLDLLTAAIARREPFEDREAFAELLNQIVEHCTDNGQLGRLGVFASLISPARDALRGVLQDNTLWMAQGRLLASLILVRHLPELRQPAPTQAPPLGPDQAWVEKTERLRFEQCGHLRAAANALVEHAAGRLRQALDLDFFEKCRKESVGADYLHLLIDAELTNSTGAPDDLVRIIRNAWIQASRWAEELRMAQYSADDAAHYLLQMARHQIRRQLQDFDSELESGRHCATILREALPALSTPISRFCADPAMWLRHLENRNHLRPVDPAALAARLAKELLLPPETARKIADAWHRVIETVRNGGRWATTTQLHQRIEQSLAGTIEEVMSSDEAREVIPAADREAITAWCERKRIRPQSVSASPGETSSSEGSPAVIRGGKRPAAGEPDDAPKGKKSRSVSSSDESTG